MSQYSFKPTEGFAYQVQVAKREHVVYRIESCLFLVVLVSTSDGNIFTLTCQSYQDIQIRGAVGVMNTGAR